MVDGKFTRVWLYIEYIRSINGAHGIPSSGGRTGRPPTPRNIWCQGKVRVRQREGDTYIKNPR